MDNHLLISLIGAVVNAVLVLIVPCALRKSNLPFSAEISKALSHDREIIISSSVIVAVVIYITLNIAPEIEKETPKQLLNFLSSMPL